MVFFLLGATPADFEGTSLADMLNVFKQIGAICAAINGALVWFFAVHRKLRNVFRENIKRRAELYDELEKDLRRSELALELHGLVSPDAIKTERARRASIK